MKLGRILLNFSIHLQIHLWTLNFLLECVLLMCACKVETYGDIPQANCLSSILLNLYSANMCDFQDDKTHIFQYADAFLIVSADLSFSVAVNNLSIKAKFFFNVCPIFTIYFAKGSRRQIMLFIKRTKMNQVKSL